MRTHILATASLAVWTAACGIELPLEVTESSASESDATTDASATETTGGTVDPTEEAETETGEPQIPAACETPDPEASAHFELALAGWSDGTTEDHDVDVACTVDALAFDGDNLATTLTCDDGVGPMPATLTIARGGAAEFGWAVGDGVWLRAKSFNDTELGLGLFRWVSLRAADDSLLVVGVEDENLGEGLFAPLTLTTGLPCGAEDIDAEVIPFQIDFARPGGETLSLIGGQRGLLDIDTESAYAIDVAEASTNNCCHFTRWHHVLLRKIIKPIHD